MSTPFFEEKSNLQLYFAGSLVGTVSANFLDTFKTPGIRYISGIDLLRFDWWIPQVVAATQNEPHLLTKNADELKDVAEAHHIMIAVDTSKQHTVVGCIALWQLTNLSRILHNFSDWFELGTLWVKPEYRFHGARHMPIADALYRRILTENQGKNILATTTNLSAIHLGARHGMQMISFASLPKEVHKATCVCPIEKTCVKNNAHCPLKDAACRVRVPFQTWKRMGKPNRTTLLTKQEN